VLDAFLIDFIVLALTQHPFFLLFVAQAYGVDVPTEVGYLYKKDVDKNETGIPHLSTVIWENPGGKLTMEAMDPPRGGIADVFVKKPRQKQLNVTVPEARLQHCGGESRIINCCKVLGFLLSSTAFVSVPDGSVPYLSLAWAHTVCTRETSASTVLHPFKLTQSFAL
jgi:hypothetical protein